MNKILIQTKSSVLYMALFFTLVLMLCIYLLTYDAVKISDISDFTIIMSNFLIPFLLFTIVLILLIALYVQKDANEVFIKNFLDANNYKSTENSLETLQYQISILNADIANFTVIPERERSITQIGEAGKSYHFNGVQGLCCFLSDYYAERVNYNNDLTGTACVAQQANYVLAANILKHFVYLHNIMLQAGNTNEELNRTHELLHYLYRSKLEYAVKIITNSGRTGTLEKAAEIIKGIYS